MPVLNMTGTTASSPLAELCKSALARRVITLSGPHSQHEIPVPAVVVIVALTITWLVMMLEARTSGHNGARLDARRDDPFHGVHCVGHGRTVCTYGPP